MRSRGQERVPADGVLSDGRLCDVHVRRGRGVYVFPGRWLVLVRFVGLSQGDRAGSECDDRRPVLCRRSRHPAPRLIAIPTPPLSISTSTPIAILTPAVSLSTPPASVSTPAGVSGVSTPAAQTQTPTQTETNPSASASQSGKSNAAAGRGVPGGFGAGGGCVVRGGVAVKGVGCRIGGTRMNGLGMDQRTMRDGLLMLCYCVLSALTLRHALLWLFFFTFFLQGSAGVPVREGGRVDTSY
ncbi:hypothetical protein C8R44DRAFT_760134 [Mycena epipterygia]|nr:hypothetical protein C8R44DRAFT_760134 [Mycena epipterygia]